MAAITERNGRFLVRVRRRGFPTVTKTFTRRSDAAAWSRRVETDMEAGRWSIGPARVPTLKEAIRDYRVSVASKLKGASTYRYRFDEFEAMPLAQRPVNEIRPAELAIWRDEQLLTRKPDTVTLFAAPVEQARIVARVEEFMRLCDELEAKGRLEAEQHDRLLRALLDTLTNSDFPEELAANWQRVAKHFDLLLDRPEAVDALEQSILDLAVRGQLVPQDSKDEPAQVLLERLRTLQNTTFRDRKQDRSESDDAAVGGAKSPFDLPPNWACPRAEDLCSPNAVITYGILKPEWVERGVPTVRVQDMQGGQILIANVGQCAPARAEKFSKTRLKAGDLLIAKDGAALGKTAFVPMALEGVNITKHVMRFPIASILDREYIRLVIDSPHGQGWMRGETQGVALPGVNVSDFRRMPIPVPPAAEQRRIVARVTELRHLCSNLRQHLIVSRSTQARLADALVESALA